MIDESRLIDNLKKEWEELCDYSENVETLLEYVIRFIGSQPKIGGWIPCSERLPENKDNVLVCWGGKNVSVGYFVSGGLGGWFFEQLAGGYKIPYEPYAWQPLPEAYHG
jgi:hypothetical protein